jgi:hypothetical protein
MPIAFAWGGWGSITAFAWDCTPVPAPLPRHHPHLGLHTRRPPWAAPLPPSPGVAGAAPSSPSPGAAHLCPYPHHLRLGLHTCALTRETAPSPPLPMAAPSPPSPSPGATRPRLRPHLRAASPSPSCGAAHDPQGRLEQATDIPALSLAGLSKWSILLLAHFLAL